MPNSLPLSLRVSLEPLCNFASSWARQARAKIPLRYQTINGEPAARIHLDAHVCAALRSAIFGLCAALRADADLTPVRHATTCGSPFIFGIVLACFAATSVI